MSKLEQLKEKAKGLEAKEPKRAVETWLEVLNNQDETNPDLSIYNRVGDLYIKLKDPALAADYYDQAVDKYAELGFHNNAIAMCNKVLRNAPARQTTYLKLAKLYAAKGFMSEAKQNFVEYAERMQKVGKIGHAFAALKEFTNISPESASLREMLSEHLKMYGADPGKRGSSAQVNTPAPRTAPPAGGDHEDHSKSGKRKTSSLVFLDLDAPSAPKGSKAPAPAAKAAPPAPPPQPPPPPVAEKLIEEVVPEPDESLEIETTSLVDESPGGGSGGAGGAGGAGTLEGLETTVADFGQVRHETPSTPSLREELNPADLEFEPVPELEPTIPDVSPDEGIELEGADLVLEGNVVEKPAAPPPGKKGAPTLKPLGRGPTGKAPEPPRVKPVVPKRPAPGGHSSSGPGKRKGVVEVPPLELEPDFETATTDKGHDVDDEPLALDETPHPHPSFSLDEARMWVRGLVEGKRLIIDVVPFVRCSCLEVGFQLEWWYLDNPLAFPRPRRGVAPWRRTLRHHRLDAWRFGSFSGWSPPERLERRRPLFSRRRRGRLLDDVPLEDQIGPFQFDSLVRAHVGDRGLELRHGLELEICRIQFLAERRGRGSLVAHLSEVCDGRLQTLERARPPRPARPATATTGRLIDETRRLDLQRLVRLRHDLLNELLGNRWRGRLWRRCRRCRFGGWGRRLRPFWCARRVEIEK